MFPKPLATENRPTKAPPPAKPQGPALLESKMLFRQGQEVVIRHQGELYRLRCTRNGKLILTK